MLGYISDSLRKNLDIKTVKDEGNFVNCNPKDMLNFLIEGFALHKVIFNSCGKPCDFQISLVNEGFQTITQISNEDVKGKKLSDFCCKSVDSWVNIFSDVALKGKMITYNNYSNKHKKLFKVNSFSPNYGEFITVFSQQKCEQRVRNNLKNWKFMAYHDPLTDLPNRRFFMEKLNQQIDNAKKDNCLFALMFIDIDNFKTINDNLGHEAGDFILKKFSFRLKKSIRKCDTVFRLGGDEFIILLKIDKETDDIKQIAKRITSDLYFPFNFENQKIHLTSSIGISLFPDHGDNFNDLIKNADKAMYSAKKEFGNYYKFYNSEQQAAK